MKWNYAKISINDRLKNVYYYFKCLKNHVSFENKKGMELYNHMSFGEYSVISQYGGGKLIIGENSYACRHAIVCSCGGVLQIGKNVQIGDCCWLSAQGGITIGNDVLLSSKVNVIANEHKYQDTNLPIWMQGTYSKPIIIGDGCWIGVNTTILQGTRLGKNCVVGANSLVKGEFPDFCVIAGNPARIIKKFDGERYINVVEESGNI